MSLTDKRERLRQAEEPALPADPGGRERIPPAVLYRAIARAIGDDVQRELPAFPRRFHVVETAPGVRRVVEELGDLVVRDVNPEAVTNAIVGYAARDLAGRPGFTFDVRSSRNAMEYWRAIVDPVPEPPAVRWADEEGLTYSRLPWRLEASPPPDAATPLFNELFGRITNAPALIEWIGSLFDQAADRQQYVWLFGQGQNGKGALLRFLAKVLGHAFRAKQPPSQTDTHWTSGLIGARLVAFPDCNAYGFPATGLFKSLSGGDLVDINPKFERSYTAELSCKFLFLSNERPQLSSERADMRRAIYCEVAPIPLDPDPAYEAALWAEGGHFLSRCIYNYRTHYPHGGPIKVETAELEDWVANVEERWEALAAEHLVIDPEECCLQTQWVSWCQDHLKDHRAKREFVAYLERKHGLRVGHRQRRTVRTSRGTAKAYGGFRLRSATEVSEAANFWT